MVRREALYKPLFVLMNVWVHLFCSKFSLAGFIIGNTSLDCMCCLFLSAYFMIYCCMILSVLNEFYYTHNNADTWQRMVILLVMVVDLIVLEG